MPHNPIRVVVGPSNYFSHPGSLNRLHLNSQGQSIFCFAVIAAKAMCNCWQQSPVTIAA